MRDRLIGSAGLLLFLCAFLPLVHSGGAVIYPFELPKLLPPYLFGLVFAVTGRHCVAALRALAIASFAPSLMIYETQPLLGLVAILASGALLATTTARAPVESSALFVGVAGTLWFALCGTSSDALLGNSVALVASIAMIVGALVAFARTAHPIVLPRVVAYRRRPGLSSEA